MVKFGNNLGTAFTIELNNKQYLVSAKHVFEGVSEKSTIEILRMDKWVPIGKVKPIFCENSLVDLIVFELQEDLTSSRALPLIVTSRDAMLSQDIYFLGYPYGIKHRIHSSDGFAFPLVKKGIISAFDGDMIWFDGHNNPGFSGGPIVVKKGNEMQVIAVVSGYRNHNAGGENSGIFYGYNIDLVISAISQM